MMMHPQHTNNTLPPLPPPLIHTHTHSPAFQMMMHPSEQQPASSLLFGDHTKPVTRAMLRRSTVLDLRPEGEGG